MAFGFPAYHKERRKLSLGVEQTRQKVLKVLALLEWEEIGFHPYALDYKTKGSMLTSGERVYINITDIEIILRSECMFFSQIVDFGKNKANIQLFWDAFDSIEA